MAFRKVENSTSLSQKIVQLPYISGSRLLWVVKCTSHRVDSGSLIVGDFLMVLSNLIPLLPYLWKDISLLQKIKYTF